MHYLLGFFSTFLKNPYFSPQYFLECIMHMTISIVIMHVTVSVVAIYVTVSSSNFIFLCLTDTHFSQFVFHHFCKYSSEIKILSRQKLYINQLKESFSTFVFLIALQKVGTSWISRKGESQKRGVVDLEKRSMTLVTNYGMLPLDQKICLSFVKCLKKRHHLTSKDHLISDDIQREPIL